MSSEDILDYFNGSEIQFILKQFQMQVESFFKENPALNNPTYPIVHSVKSRIKATSHLEDKLKRKGTGVTKENLFDKVNDLIGVRVLHLYQSQLREIHDEIQKKVDTEEWVFVENPKVYTWDPENRDFFSELGLVIDINDSFYTSVHYVIRPATKNAFITCEIQVRTLFEEIWGEISHSINYPNETESIACQEQIKTLAKLTNAGTRLSESIIRSFDEYKSR
ncbi:RelA/SpoT domain-containing protein [Listeria booriae]|uniref:RelA/SpoT domain-containing protein n=1 Tax=Listeria booriae TaxID=1552123 RepID=UPI0016241D30|nr:RelA/SpoT domain-containing protein [Listeria booriae]MBC2170938.1 (p)ppGpp synthetase [Listeria booriae]